MAGLEASTCPKQVDWRPPSLICTWATSRAGTPSSSSPLKDISRTTSTIAPEASTFETPSSSVLLIATSDHVFNRGSTILKQGAGEQKFHKRRDVLRSEERRVGKER